MGCVSSKKASGAQAGGAQAEEVTAAPVLTEASAEERALVQLKTIFISIDVNKDGNVSKAELVTALDKDASIGDLIKDAGLNQEYNAMEQLQTGEVQGIELAAHEKAVQQLKKLFDTLDSNKDGAVNREELAAGMNKDASIGQLIKEADLNPDYYVL